MAYSARVIADSISPIGKRLVTVEVEYPHAVHKDILRHRVHASSYMSFRAVPTEKLLPRLREDPFIPEEFNSRVKGMGGGAALDPAIQQWIRFSWKEQIHSAIQLAEDILASDSPIAKQQLNFLLQDFSWIKGIITGTEWDNFFALRHFAEGARPEVRKIAGMIWDAVDGSSPQTLFGDQWHLPYIKHEELEVLCGQRKKGGGLYEPTLEMFKRVSARRCARISFDKHLEMEEVETSIAKANGLIDDGHLSPTEHQARPMNQGEIMAVDAARYAMDEVVNMGAAIDPQILAGMKRQVGFLGNLDGWVQFRKEIPNEQNFGLIVGAVDAA